MENVCSAFPYRTHNLFVNSAIWMKYVALIGDPREPNSNSSLVCVEVLEEGPMYCSAQLTDCCFNGRWEINGDLMTVGRTQHNNRVLAQRRPSTLVSLDNYVHECTYTHIKSIHVWNVLTKNIPSNKHICTEARRVKMSIDLSVKKFCSHLPSVHPVSSQAKQMELILKPANPPMWQKKANLCIADMVCEE